MYLVEFKTLTNTPKNKYEIHSWLLGATVGDDFIKLVNPKKFFEKIEELNGIIQTKDWAWVQDLCMHFLKRLIKQPKLEEVGTEKIKVGTDANKISSNIKDVKVKKAAYWEKNGMKRIYFDSKINNKDHHCYLNIKNGAFYEKGGNETNTNFKTLTPYFLEFVGVKNLEELLTWKQVKAA